MTIARADMPAVMRILRQEYRRFRVPYVTRIASAARPDPFKVLVSCVISLRTRDEVTRAASERLFGLAASPAAMARLSEKEIERAIYPAGFYRRKARDIKELSGRLASEHGSRVPDTIDGLLEFRGVGRKTANLVVTMGHGKPGICVDAHVHRIVNRWGLVDTRGPDETEEALRERLARRYWIPLNDLLVAFGQNVCTPVSPRCGGCRLCCYCERRGVVTRR